MTEKEASLKFSKWVESSQYYWDVENQYWVFLDADGKQTTGITDDQVYNIYLNAPPEAIAPPPQEISVKVSVEKFISGNKHTAIQDTPNGKAVGIISDGWLDFDVNIPADGQYRLVAIVACITENLTVRAFDFAQLYLGKAFIPRGSDWNTLMNLYIDLNGDFKAGLQKFTIRGDQFNEAFNLFNFSLIKK